MMTSPAGFETKRNRSKVTRGKSRYAFTLVELMVVLAIVVVFAGTVATVRFGTRGSLAVEYEAPRLLSILKLCRERSLQTGRVHRLAIDREARQFWIEWEVDPLDGKGTFEPFSDGGRTRHEWEEDVSWLEVSYGDRLGLDRKSRLISSGRSGSRTTNCYRLSVTQGGRFPSGQSMKSRLGRPTRLSILIQVDSGRRELYKQ